MSDEHVSPAEPVMLEVEPISEGLRVEDLTGSTLAGRYDVECPIGKGGMGLVYLARQSALNRQVVVKVLAQDVCEDEEAITRFEREALGLSQLQHPNIVTIYDFGQDQGMAYIVMEYVDGQTLSAKVRRDGPMSFDDFAHISTQILDALAEAHARGIIHRDIKPSNIMLCTRRGHANVVKVLDFGLAKIVHDPQEVTKKTNLVGSVAFLAPEQILGHAFDQRVDVYALGVLFYYMLSGARPFHGDDDMAVLYQHIHKEAAPLASVLPQGHMVPPEVISIIHQCLSKDPNDRPEDARAVLDMLQRDMSRSIFRMPWSTGEWAVPTGVQVVSPHMHDGVNLEGLSTSSASDISLPTFDAGEEDAALSGTYDVPKKRPIALLMGVLVLVLVLTISAGLLLINQERERTSALQASTASALEKVEELLEDGKVVQARDKLGALTPSDDWTEQHRAKAQALRAKLEQRSQAAATPQQPEAVAGSTPAVAQTTRLTVDAPVKAKVYVEGTFVGYTPVTVERAAGDALIEVRAKGHKTWTKRAALVADQPLVLDADLTRASQAPARSTPKRTTKPQPPKKRLVAPVEPKAAPVTPKAKPAPKPPKSDGLLFKPGGKTKSGSGLRL